MLLHLVSDLFAHVVGFLPPETCVILLQTCRTLHACGDNTVQDAVVQDAIMKVSVLQDKKGALLPSFWTRGSRNAIATDVRHLKKAFDWPRMAVKVLWAQRHPLGTLVKVAGMVSLAGTSLSTAFNASDCSSPADDALERMDDHCMRDVTVSVKEYVVVDEVHESRCHHLSVTAKMSWYGLQLCAQGALVVNIYDFERQVRGALVAEGLVANVLCKAEFVPTLLRCRW